MALAMNKTDIMDVSRDEMAAWLATRAAAPYHTGQILRWVYHRQVDSFDAMTDIGKSLRKELADAFEIKRLDLETVQTSKDGTQKFLFRLQDGETTESVLIPEKNRYTLCISSQVGCAQGCRFCLTAETGFSRNLTQGEIISQVRDIARTIKASDTKRLTNIVFMGMGEPLANYHNVIGAVETLILKEEGMGFSTRRITLSTAGLVPKFRDLGKDTEIKLAVSLNAADNDTRSRLMPINRKYPIEQVIDACRHYPLKPGRRITFEYILLKGENDSMEDARRLGRLLSPVRSKINLIPINEHEGCRFEKPEEGTILAFQKILLKKHHTVMIRRSRGQDISAACGQLRAARHIKGRIQGKA